VRPHDIEVHTAAVDGAQAGVISRTLRVGFEMRVDVEVVGDEADAPATVLVTMTRAEFQAHRLVEGTKVWLRAVDGAPRLPC
jgi:sulfate transport system ATP-binding protein